MTAEAQGRAAASCFRLEHHLGIQPLGDLVAVIEQTTGVDVAVLDAGPDEHGLTMCDPAYGTVFIGVARTRYPMRQRSTLAHELGHVQFGDWAADGAGNCGRRSPAEIRADAFARHLLLPLDGLQQFLTDQRVTSRSVLSAVVQRYLVSPAVAAIALEQAGYIEAVRKAEWMGVTTPQLAVRFGWIDQYNALQADSNRRRAPQRLLSRAIEGWAAGVLSAQVIANLRGVALEVAEAELAEAGIVPADQQTIWADPANRPGVSCGGSQAVSASGSTRAA
ncbi:ImmA/IrrE family metallo-endopeptidase [Solwaraspora sp. WMMB335]|uniref:ImmA/IrrE family metallo-endopeptidase n=1 Tax=Solwaraspora sp. WMMB335 TaxID=3404118 RepID=UPI003B9483C2